MEVEWVHRTTSNAEEIVLTFDELIQIAKSCESDYETVTDVLEALLQQNRDVEKWPSILKALQIFDVCAHFGPATFRAWALGNAGLMYPLLIYGSEKNNRGSEECAWVQMMAYGLLNTLIDEKRLDNERAQPHEWWKLVEKVYQFQFAEKVVLPWYPIGLLESQTEPAMDDAPSRPLDSAVPVSPPAIPFPSSDSFQTDNGRIHNTVLTQPFVPDSYDAFDSSAQNGDSLTVTKVDPPMIPPLLKPEYDPTTKLGATNAQLTPETGLSSGLPQNSAIELHKDEVSVTVASQLRTTRLDEEDRTDEVNAAIHKMFRPTSDYKDEKFCRVCRDLDGNKGPPTSMKLGHRVGAIMKLSLDIDWHILQVSAEKSGCTSCRLLYEGLKPFLAEYGDEYLKLMVTDDASDKKPCLTVTVSKRHELGASMTYILYVKPGNSSPWRAIKSRATTVQSASIKECVATFVASQMATCSSSHLECTANDAQHKQKPSYLPNRLVHVGRPFLDCDPFLVEVAAPDQSLNLSTRDLRYVALSHCWGTTMMLKTTKETLASRKQKIEWNSLGPTFRDAIEVCRELGIQAIWIDSLCIVQDDAEDWAHESALMGDIYSNAYVTVAATATSSEEQGLFKPRPQFHHTVRGAFDGKEYEVHVLKEIGHDEFGAFRSGGSDTFRKLPLLTRGWTLQEQILSPRVLHFTREELIWDCLDGKSCECGAEHQQNEKWLMPRPSGTANHFTENRSLAWNSLLSDFCARRLTFDKDRLPALSGLASRFGDESTGKYYAGFWGGHFPNCLLWYPSRVGRRCETAENPISLPPSWSWCSVDYRPSGIWRWIFRDNEIHNGRMYAKVVDIQTYPSTSDPRGMVSGGHITLKGRVMPLKIALPEDLTEEQERDGRGEYSFQYTHSRIIDMEMDFEPDVPLTSTTEQVKSGDDLCFFEIVSPRPLGRKTLRGAGLVLRPAKESVDAASIRNCKAGTDRLFRRVGYGSIHATSEDYNDLNIDRRDYYIGSVTII